MSEEQTDEQINVRVVNQEGQEIFFKIKRTTPLRRLMDAYASRQGLDTKGVRFLFVGERLKDDATPQSLGMQDQDVIDAVAQQTGGL